MDALNPNREAGCEPVSAEPRSALPPEQAGGSVFSDALVSDFVERVVDHPREAPRWWKQLLAEFVRRVLRRKALIDAPAPWTEWQACRRAA